MYFNFFHVQFKTLIELNFYVTQVFFLLFIDEIFKNYCFPKNNHYFNMEL